MSPVMPTYARAPLAFVEGKGSWLIDERGQRFLDAGAGIAVSILGHAHPRLVEALSDQAERLWHTSNLYRVPGQERLAKMLVDHSFADSVFFTNSGAEAAEAAVKMARRYWHANGKPERNRIVTLHGCFHGRTTAMISATGSDYLTEGFAPLAPGFDQVPPGNIEAMKAAVGSNTAAIFVETVLGEGGIIPLEDRYLRDLRTFCDETGTLLILDEIQCGMGRTGRLFAHQWAGIDPDIMAVAKGIGGGFPLGACLATEKVASTMTAGSHGSTYGGNPLACAVGLAVMEIVSDEEFLAGVRRRAAMFRQRIESVVASHPSVFESVRGSGLMLGIVCHLPAPEVIKAAYAEELLIVPAAKNVVRILPPLNMDNEELAEVASRIERVGARLEGTPDARLH